MPRSILNSVDAAPRAGSPLEEFLAARRSTLNPAAVGLPDYGDRRRVPDSRSRREEVAQPAGVGVASYIRLEQGESLNASPQVLYALAKPSAWTRRNAGTCTPRQVRGGSGPALDAVAAVIRQDCDSLAV
jgi:hypothetical protein